MITDTPIPFAGRHAANPLFPPTSRAHAGIPSLPRGGRHEALRCTVHAPPTPGVRRSPHQQAVVCFERHAKRLHPPYPIVISIAEATTPMDATSAKAGGANPQRPA